jgi:hypothetical protein
VAVVATLTGCGGGSEPTPHQEAQTIAERLSAREFDARQNIVDETDELGIVDVDFGDANVVRVTVYRDDATATAFCKSAAPVDTSDPAAVDPGTTCIGRHAYQFIGDAYGGFGPEKVKQVADAGERPLAK